MKYRKRPIVIEAIQYLGRTNCDAVHKFLELDHVGACVDEIYINTLEGEMIARPGDWVIKGIAGEFYPCKDKIFIATYEEETR